jgi:hypothetical protein
MNVSKHQIPPIAIVTSAMAANMMRTFDASD